VVHGVHSESVRDVSEREGRGVGVLVVNGRSEHWVDHGGEYWAVATLVDMATGVPVPTVPHWIGGTGRSYDLAPGQRVTLPVALGIDPAVPIPPGVYEIRATVEELALEAPPGRLRITG
jgi:hypothetical protein